MIINLWGMTGVGKTDLVRCLVSELGMQDRFAEVELSNGDVTSYRSSVGQVLRSNQIPDGQPAIVLFDEIQRFNTLDSDGKPLTVTKFTDFWELLSDGRLAKRERTDLDNMMNELRFNMRDARRRREHGEEVELDPAVGWWQANSMRETLGLGDSADEIAEMHQSELVDRIMAAKRSKKVYEPVDHSQTLCIISGNLDESYSMAGLTAEADVDADIFHAFTRKITAVDIKTALSRRSSQNRLLGSETCISPTRVSVVETSKSSSGASWPGWSRRRASDSDSRFRFRRTSRSSFTATVCFRCRVCVRCSRRWPISWSPTWRVS